MRSASLFAATLTALACSSGERQRAASTADSVFTPREYSVADFYRNTSYFGASFSPKADRILVTSNASGVYNAYAIPTAGGKPEPLTTSTDNAVFAVSCFPADDRILYSSDQGGNELQSPLRAPARRQHEGPDAGREAQGRVRRLGRRRPLVLRQHQRARPAVLRSLRVRRRRATRRKLFYRNTEGYRARPDLPRQAVPRARAPARHRPTPTSSCTIGRPATTTLITKHTGQVSNIAAGVHAGRQEPPVHLRQRAGVRRAPVYDIATGRRTTVYEQPWDILGAGYSKGGKYLIVGVNEDSRPDARLLDAATLKPVELPGMPPGLVRGIELSRDESAIAFYASDGSVPDDLWAGAIGERPRSG